MDARLLHGDELEALGERDDEIDLRSVADLRKPLVLCERAVLLQLERHDRIDVVICDLQDEIGLSQRRRVHPIEHALVAVQVRGGAGVEAEILEQALLHAEHRLVMRADLLELPVGQTSREGDAVDVDVDERHEHADHEALALVRGIADGVAQGVALPLDVHDGLVGHHGLLIDDDAVGGREETARVGEGGPRGIPKEILLRQPAQRLLLYGRHLLIHPLAQTFRHRPLPTWRATGARARTVPDRVRSTPSDVRPISLISCRYVGHVPVTDETLCAVAAMPQRWRGRYRHAQQSWAAARDGRHTTHGLAARRRPVPVRVRAHTAGKDRKSTRLNSSHSQISYAVFCLKKKNDTPTTNLSYHGLLSCPRHRHCPTTGIIHFLHVHCAQLSTTCYTTRS